MDRVLLLRRVLLLCCHFARNLAYYRAAWRDKKHIRNTDFWVTTSGNSYGQCVLEWCKLFGDLKGEHYWKTVVTDPDKFESHLYATTGLTADSLEAYRLTMRTYRDKFVAHLDLQHTAMLPSLDNALATIRVLHAHIVATEIPAGALGRLPTDLGVYEGQKAKEAEAIYASN